MILSTLTMVLIGIVALLLLWAALAPLESLGWWAGWFGDVVTSDAASSLAAAPESPNRHFLVYLSGIGAIDPQSIPQEEIDWGKLALKRLPGTTVVTEVFPYSVTNSGLTSQHLTSALWRYLEQRRLRNSSDVLQFLINVRNMFNVAISADRRYGPIYNLGVATEIVEALQRRGYRLRSGKPITLVGFSGGAQISLGAAVFLRPLVKAPIRIISIGGVMSDDIGVGSVTRLYHLWGHLDPVQGLGERLYAGRWPLFPQSDWNLAVAQGRIEFVDMGQMHHNGSTNYFSWTAFTPDGRSHAMATIDTIGDLLVREGLLDPEALQQAREATVAEARAYEQVRVAAVAQANQARG